MNNKLKINDYVTILSYYKTKIPKSRRLLKLKGEEILADKLCRCIKKMNKTNKNEKRAIGICTKTIINRKGLKRGRFTCRNKKNITLHL